MAIYLLDKSLQVKVFYEENDSNFPDNICISICEDCPENEKVFRADETNLFITNEEARNLAIALLNAIQESEE